jgi:phage major head subunit gpT-like protein
MGTPLVTENFGDLLEPGLRKIFDDQYQALPSMVPSLYNMGNASTSYEKVSSVGAFGDFSDFDTSGQIVYDDIAQGYDTKIEFKQWVSGFQVERKLYDDELYGIINKKPRGLAISAQRTREKHGASPFNDAFSATGTENMTGMDGLSLCNSAHTSNASSGYTNQSNTGTTALSATAIEATRRLMAAWTDDRGNIIAVNPDLILIPRALEETAWTIIATKGKVDSAENNANFHYGKYKLAVWDYLSDSNNWFFIDSTMMKTMLEWYDRIPLEFGQETSFDTFISKFRAYMRYGRGWNDWRWVYGHNVS